MATEYKDKISVSVPIADVNTKVCKHLAVIGKRAKTINGESMFSDLTVSSAEKDIFNDLIKAGAETIVNELQPFCGIYNTTYSQQSLGGTVGNGGDTIIGGTIDKELSKLPTTNTPSQEVLSFVITATRWTDDDASATESNNKNLTKALHEAIGNYLYNYTLWQYLSIIHPSTGAKYPPIYGSTYQAQCAVIISNVVGLCNIKRPAKKSVRSYADITSSITE